MSRQLDIKREIYETARRDALVKALEFGIVGSLEMQGIELQGIAIRYDAFNCLLTLKAHIAGIPKVSFVGSDTMMNVLLKADSMSRNNVLKWKVDQYAKGKD